MVFTLDVEDLSGPRRSFQNLVAEGVMKILSFSLVAGKVKRMRRA